MGRSQCWVACRPSKLTNHKDFLSNFIKISVVSWLGTTLAASRIPIGKCKGRVETLKCQQIHGVEAKP